MKAIARNVFIPLGVLALAVAASAETGPPIDDWAWTLDRFVDDEGQVDYAGLAADRERLDRFVAHVEAVSPTSTPDPFVDRDAELAYLIDAYNALVFASVLDLDLGVDSVWGKSGTGYGFFVKRKVRIGGKKIGLKGLEDDLIRAPYGDPRIHAALNCASRGCPRLPREPFSQGDLDARLASAMQEFLDDPRHLTVDDAARTVTLSKIFDWFTKDFVQFEKSQGTQKPNLIDYVNRYRSDTAQVPRDYKIRFATYDKSLNRQAPNGQGE